MRYVTRLLSAVALVVAVIVSGSGFGFGTTPPVNAYLQKIAVIRNHAYAWALSQKGKPYIWGGTGPYGYDCSGLVWKAYLKAGKRLPRTTYGMLGSTALRRVVPWHARRGDLAFYGRGHVEMYVNRYWSYGTESSGVGFHHVWPNWHPTMYYRIRTPW